MFNFSFNVEECSHWKKLLAIKVYFLKGFIRLFSLNIFHWANFVGHLDYDRLVEP